MRVQILNCPRVRQVGQIDGGSSPILQTYSDLQLESDQSVTAECGKNIKISAQSSKKNIEEMMEMEGINYIYTARG